MVVEMRHLEMLFSTLGKSWRAEGGQGSTLQLYIRPLRTNPDSYEEVKTGYKF